MSDELIETIAEYTLDPPSFSKEAWETAALCLKDSIACALLAQKLPACTKHLGPIVPGATLENGSHVIGTHHRLDPIQATFQNGLLIRWLDYNDTWLAKEWGHPSDNLAGILAVGDWLEKPLTVKQALEAMIQAYEIQGILALDNSMNAIGFDHVFFVKIATTAVITKLLGGNQKQIEAALSHAFIDTGPLRSYRHAPNVNARKSWAAGDAAARGVFLAFHAIRGDEHFQAPLTAKKWGFYDALFKGNPFQLSRPLGSYVMENILFKVSFPAEFHAQTAVEAAFALYKKHAHTSIDSIEIETQEAGLKIIAKEGPLHNPADRDHCLQYMVAVGLLKGSLEASDYETENSEIEDLRKKMKVKEDPKFTKDYFDPEKRSIGNRITLKFSDGSSDSATVEYPVGHKKRREEAKPLLLEKFHNALKGHYEEAHVKEIMKHLTNLRDGSISSLLKLIKKRPH